MAKFTRRKEEWDDSTFIQIFKVEDHPNIRLDSDFESGLALLTNETLDGKNYGINRRSMKIQIHPGDWLCIRPDGYFYTYDKDQFEKSFVEVE